MNKASDLLTQLFGTVDLGQLKGLGTLVSQWQSIVGVGFAGHSRPKDVKNSGLLVVVDSSPWLMKIKFEEKRIIRELKKRVPQLGITRIMWKIGSLDRPEHFPESPQRRELSEPSREEILAEKPQSLEEKLERLKKALKNRDSEGP